ncbi:MAG: YqzL family protein [Cellulosilyticaceae bacterium]
MIHNLWNCFEATGHIETYLSFKEYERTRNAASMTTHMGRGENEIT